MFVVKSRIHFIPFPIIQLKVKGNLCIQTIPPTYKKSLLPNTHSNKCLTTKEFESCKHPSYPEAMAI